MFFEGHVSSNSNLTFVCAYRRHKECVAMIDKLKAEQPPPGKPWFTAEQTAWWDEFLKKQVETDWNATGGKCVGLGFGNILCSRWR